MALVKFKQVLNSRTHLPTKEATFIVEGVDGDVFKRQFEGGKLRWWVNRTEVTGQGSRTMIGHLEEEFQNVLPSFVKSLMQWERS